MRKRICRVVKRRRRRGWHHMAAHLAAAKHDVIVIDDWPEQVAAIRSEGLKIVGMVASESIQTRIPAMHVTEVQGLAKGSPIDIAIVSVKSYDTLWATALIALTSPPTATWYPRKTVSTRSGSHPSSGGNGRSGCVVGNNFAVDLIEAGVVKRTMPRDRFGQIPGAR